MALILFGLVFGFLALVFFQRASCRRQHCLGRLRGQHFVVADPTIRSRLPSASSCEPRNLFDPLQRLTLS
jgi:hypothetical protein